MIPGGFLKKNSVRTNASRFQGVLVPLGPSGPARTLGRERRAPVPPDARAYDHTVREPVSALTAPLRLSPADSSPSCDTIRGGASTGALLEAAHPVFAHPARSLRPTAPLQGVSPAERRRDEPLDPDAARRDARLLQAQPFFTDRFHQKPLSGPGIPSRHRLVGSYVQHG